MKNLRMKTAALAALLTWFIGVAAFVLSYFVPIMDNPDEQANWVLAFALLPATLIGAHFYFQHVEQTNGIVLGAFMFLITILLDASLTVPFFIMPYGGNHQSFFGDPLFWLLGVEYVTMVAAYEYVRKEKRISTSSDRVR